MPRETRVAVNLVAYDKNKKKNFTLGSSSVPIFNENGIMESNKIELFLWPLYKVDQRVVCTAPYLGKYHLKGDQQPTYNKEDYCTIILEFPLFSKPIIYTLKSPQSYREFLKLKNPHIDDINSMTEITSLYENSFEHLDKIIESLRDTDTYFMNIDKKRKDKNERNRNDDSDEEDENELINERHK